MKQEAGGMEDIGFFSPVLPCSHPVDRGKLEAGSWQLVAGSWNL